MPGDLYDLLAQQPTEPDVPDEATGAGPVEHPPGTKFTASVETIDNDYATYLLGNVAL